MNTENTPQASSGLTDEFFEHATGRDKYFKPLVNKDQELLLTKWRPVMKTGKNGVEDYGLEFDVLKVDGVEFTDPIKVWSTSSKRVVRELEPILRAAIKKKKSFIRIVFRKSLPSNRPDTDAVFTARNLDIDLDELLAPEQRSGGVNNG